MTEQFDDQGLFRKGIRFQGVARGPQRDEETGRLVPNSAMELRISPPRGIVVGLIISGCVLAGSAIAYYGLVLLAVLRGTR